MALDKRTIKIIAIVVSTLIVVVVFLGLLIGLLQRSDDNIELQVWPRGADGYAQPLISYKHGDEKSVEPWVQRVATFLSTYMNYDVNHVACDYTKPPQDNQVCNVYPLDFHPCVAVYQYNYGRASPCVFLKLDKILDWTPKPYNITEELPQSMPEGLKRDINVTVGTPQANEVWVSCDGVEPADKEYIGPLKYIPSRGFPTYFFPSKNKGSYISPLIAVMFERPQTNVLINVECKAWAKNINTCKDCEPTASVRFQLMID